MIQRRRRQVSLSRWKQDKLELRLQQVFCRHWPVRVRVGIGIGVPNWSAGPRARKTGSRPAGVIDIQVQVSMHLVRKSGLRLVQLGTNRLASRLQC